jgi:DNA-binding MarR family transcriptional regulator
MADEMDEETVAALRAAVLILARRLRHQVADQGDLSATDLAVLGRIGEHVQPPSMTKIIERLEGLELLRRDPHPTDRRQYLVSRTAAGEAFVEASRALRTTWLVSHLDGLSADDRRLIAAAAPALGRLADLP